MIRGTKALVFVRTRDPAVLDLVGFYRDDIKALRDLGAIVEVVTRVRDLPRHTTFDFVYAWWFGFGFFPVLWAWLHRRPSILTGTVHSVEGGGLENWPWHKRIVMKAALRLATKTVFISNAELKRLGNASASSPSVAYCAVDLDSHRPSSEAPGKFILSITHLTPENVARKMVLESLTAFARFQRMHPEYRYVIAGVHGEAICSVREHISRLGLDGAVDLPGRVSFERKVALLQSAAAYLQPSRCEGFGLAILEATACGCPVVTNREPCIEEINVESVLYGETEEELAEKLSALVTDSSLREEMRKRGLSNARRFSYESRRTAIHSILESMRSSGKGGTAGAGIHDVRG